MSDEQAVTLAALARDIERATRRLTELAERADQADADRDRLDALIGDLARTVQTVASPSGSWLLDPPPGRPDGPQPPTRAELMEDLADWMARVYLRYPDATLPSCWAWHPCVIEELLWLRRAHHEAHTARVGRAAQIGNWHDRFRPGVVRRIAGYVHDCELSRHCAHRDRHDQGPPRVPLASYLPVIAAAWDDRRGFPDPLASMLDEAAAHDVPEPV